MDAIRQLHPADVRERLRTGADGDGLLLDVREAWELELARLPGTVHIPLAELPFRWRELDPAREIIVCCHHGIRSWHAACFLQGQGFSRVANLAGGIDAWAREPGSGVPRY